MTRLFQACLLAVLFWPAVVAAEPQLGGSVRNLSQLGASSALLPESNSLSVTILRLGARENLTPRLEGEVAIENRWLYVQPRGVLPFGAGEESRLFDLSSSWEEDEHLAGQLQVDRLSLRGRIGSLSWTVGRQAYGFGSILLFSPLDVIAPFAPTAIDTEYRPGIDALRADLTTDAGDQLGLLAALARDARQNSYLATGHFNRVGVDLQLLVGRLRDRDLLGVGLAGSLGGLGVKGEAAWYRGRESGRDLHDDFPMAALELWYRFQSDLVLLAELLHNGAGSSDPDAYLQSAVSAANREGISPFLGQNYLLIAPSYDLHSLISLSALYIRNLDDHSWLLRPRISISLGDNLSLDISHSINRGTAPRVGPFPGLVTPRSEFGLYGDSAAAYLRWYF